MSQHLLSIQRLYPPGTPDFPGYFVVSTAPINIEDEVGDLSASDPNAVIREIGQHLRLHAETAEVLVIVHGYNTPKSGVENWYKQACEDIAKHYNHRPQGLVVLGYRWPSEQVTEDESGKFAAKRQFAHQSLPSLLSMTSRCGILGTIVGSIAGIIGLIAIASHNAIALSLMITSGIILFVSLLAISPILTLLLLRLSVYFRDTFRASNYGVADLVELIRQLDNAMVGPTDASDYGSQITYWETRRVRLSFIGHSMGAFVVTNAVRVLSDVFDHNSIGSLDAKQPTKCPSSAIGHVFSLGRLVLVAPDIPAESIISGRANMLRSSLRRFEEAYLFSNEGDMALRLASTTANYFTFPTRTRDGGYRLGNVSVRAVGEARANESRTVEKLGIVNQATDGELLPLNLLDYLYIRRSKPLSVRQRQISLGDQEKPIAELFTYFDCTNYTESVIDAKTGQAKAIGIVSQALNKRSLNTLDYFALTLDFFAGKIDPHGGYIFNPHAKFSKRCIYGLACLGFNGFLASLKADPLFPAKLKEIKTHHPTISQIQQENLAALRVLSNLSEQQGIQVLLAPERYRVDVLGQPRDRMGY
jgi:Alpha/beta hydrolase of unknown function (DUF900)